MAEVGPLAITARNAAQAEYVARSRAEQRGVPVQSVDVTDGGNGAWYVTVTVDDRDADRLADAHLDVDTQVLHFRSHTRRESR
jgi:(2Fe-2S) ferredoxin